MDNRCRVVLERARLRGEIDHPPVFNGFHQGNRFKIGKMYEVLTAMVFNQLL